MKFIVSVILYAALSFAVSLYLPWWTIVFPVYMVSAVMQLKPGGSFLAAFISIFIFWGLFALIISINNDHVLANKMSVLIFKNENPWLLIIVTGLIGGIVAGFSALSGSLLIKNK